MIVVKTQGGLGNQMFQYALGRAVSLRVNTSLGIDASLFEHYPHHAYGLNRYHIAATTIPTHDANAFARMKPRIGRRHFLHNFLFANPERYRVERMFNYDPDIISAHIDAYYDGYWQTERYFADYANTIRTDFTLTDGPMRESLALAAEMKDINAVSLHVRRGLYVTHPIFSSVHGSCGPDYFDRALAYIAEHTQNPHIYIFSDDQPWAKENVRPPFPTTYIEHTNAETPHDDIYLMSSCAHHIIANSTFSWWGAWLNPSPTKIVVGPAKWFQQEKFNTVDVLPPTWVRV